MTSMSNIKTLWKTQSLSLSIANQLRVLASRAQTSGSLDKIQETCAQGLEVYSNLVHACHFYQQDQPTNFYASPNAALCGLTLHSWRHTTTASPRTLARQARARTAGALFKISNTVFAKKALVVWRTCSKTLYRHVAGFLALWTRHASLSAYLKMQSRPSLRVRPAFLGWLQYILARMWHAQLTALLSAAHKSNSLYKAFANWNFRTLDSDFQASPVRAPGMSLGTRFTCFTSTKLALQGLRKLAF